MSKMQSLVLGKGGVGGVVDTKYKQEASNFFYLL